MKVYAVSEDYEAPTAYFSTLEKAKAWAESKKESHRAKFGHAKFEFHIEAIALDVDVETWWDGVEED